MSWAVEEFEGINLGDKRLDQRAVLLAERLAEKPTASLPGACNGWAETQGAYRFFAQEELDWRDILKPHGACVGERMRPHRVVLCIQDTTELDFNGQAMAGLGPLSDEAQRGMYVHLTYAVTPAREPLGVLDAWMWSREFKDDQGVRGVCWKACGGSRATSGWRNWRPMCRIRGWRMWRTGSLTSWSGWCGRVIEAIRRIG